MSDDFDEKMSALMGRMTAWKSKQSAPESPPVGDVSTAPGASSSSWDTGSQGGESSTTLPATPDFQTRPACDSQTRLRVPKGPGFRDASVGQTGEGLDYGHNFNFCVPAAERKNESRFRDVLGEAQTDSIKSALPMCAVEEAAASPLPVQLSAEREPSSPVEFGAGDLSTVPATLAAAHDGSAFDNQINELEQRMLAWKNKTQGPSGVPAMSEYTKTPLSPVRDTSYSFVSSVASSPSSPLLSQHCHTESLPNTPPAPRPVLGSHGNVFSSMRSSSSSVEKRPDGGHCQYTPSMSSSIPDEVWASNAPAHDTSYVFLSGMSSARTAAHNYAAALPAPGDFQEEAVELQVQHPEEAMQTDTVQVGSSSSRSSRSSWRSPRRRRETEQVTESAGSNQLLQRVSSLEESVHNIEQLLRCLVNENPKVRDSSPKDAVRPGRWAKAKPSRGSTGAIDPNEQSQRAKLRDSSATSLDSGRVRAAMRAPHGYRGTVAGITAGNKREATATALESQQGNGAEDEECPVRRGRFHWPLDILRAREELRDEVLVSARHQ